jgi:hypothetical protein
MTNLYVSVFPNEAIRIPQLVRPSSNVKSAIKVECIDPGVGDGESSALLHAVFGADDHLTTEASERSQWRQKLLKADGHLTTEASERSQWRQKLLKVLDGEKVLMLIIVLVIVGLASLMLEEWFEVYNNSQVASVLEKLVLAAFIVETCLRAAAMGVTAAAAKAHGYETTEHKGYANDTMCRYRALLIAATAPADRRSSVKQDGLGDNYLGPLWHSIQGN